MKSTIATLFAAALFFMGTAHEEAAEKIQDGAAITAYKTKIKTGEI